MDATADNETLNQDAKVSLGSNNSIFNVSTIMSESVKYEHLDDASTVNGNSLKVEVEQCKLYKRRYFILAIFCFFSMSNAFQWIQYAIIQNIVKHYYSVDDLTINWLSLVYMIAYIPFIFPATWMIEKKGLRKSILIGSLGNCVAAWIKCASVSPDRYWVTLIGQIVASVSQIFILGIPAPLAATWFSDKDVSRACAVGVFGNQVGVALGFLIPPTIVRMNEDRDAIGHDLHVMFYSIAAITTVIFICIIFAFQDAPPVPPSKAQASSQVKTPVSYKESMKRLFWNKNYVILLISYGTNTGVYYAISTLLNQSLEAYFKHQEATIGWIGLTLVIAGLFGSVLAGFILDKTHAFKETSLVVYVLCVVFMVVYAATISLRKTWIMFLTAGALGFFMTGYLPVGFEFAAELTYPEPEGTSSGLLNASAQFFGIVFTISGSELLTYYSDLACNMMFISVLIVGFVMSMFIKPHLRRQQAGNIAICPSANSL